MGERRRTVAVQKLRQFGVLGRNTAVTKYKRLRGATVGVR